MGTRRPRRVWPAAPRRGRRGSSSAIRHFMQLSSNLHLAYCTNVHRGENWAETFAALEKHVLPVRQRVAPGQGYAIGLRLGQRAAAELAVPATLLAFQRWLEKHDSYVFTLNGF